MRAAPAGAIVKLYVDLVRDVEPEHWIKTANGRMYQVLTVREQMRGKHIGRQHLTVMVMGDGHTPASAQMLRDIGFVVHEIRWYKRNAIRKRA